jgi:hypothetical protein
MPIPAVRTSPAILAFLCFSALAPRAFGAIYTYTMSGTASSRNLGTGIVPAPWAGFESGSFSLSLTIDSSSPDVVSDPRYGSFNAISAQATINGVAATLTSPSFSFNNYNGTLPASVEVGIGGYVTNPSLNVFAMFRFTDPTGQNLPRIVSDLNSLPTPTNYFLIFNGAQYANFNVSNGQRQTTPAPGVGAMLVPLAMLASRRRR